MSRPRSDHDVFRAVADPVRHRILTLLSRGPLTPGELVVQVGRAGSTVSEHLRILRAVGLVVDRPRGVQLVYALRTERLRALREWLQSTSRT